MLPALALVLAQTSSDSYPLPVSMDEVSSRMAQAGYPIHASATERGRYEIPQGATRATVDFWTMVGDPKRGEPATRYVGFDVTIELPAGPKAGFSSVEAYPHDDRGTGVPTFAYHLGRTVTESEQIEFGHPSATIKAMIERFFREGRAFAKAFGVSYAAVPEPKGVARGFTDATRLARADDTSLRRAVAAWGWAAPTGKSDVLSMTVSGWMVEMRVGGKSLFLEAALGPDHQPLPSRFDVIRFDDRATDAFPKADGSEERPWTAVRKADGWHVPAAKETIDLGSGLTLAAIRSRIATFATEG